MKLINKNEPARGRNADLGMTYETLAIFFSSSGLRTRGKIPRTKKKLKENYPSLQSGERINNTKPQERRCYFRLTRFPRETPQNSNGMTFFAYTFLRCEIKTFHPRAVFLILIFTYKRINVTFLQMSLRMFTRHELCIKEKNYFYRLLIVYLPDMIFIGNTFIRCILF